MLPIAVTIINSGIDAIRFLLRHMPASPAEDSFVHLVSKWLVYFPSFADAVSRDLTRRSLATILALSATDLEVSSLKLISGQFSKEEVLLQVGILSMLASDLVPGGEKGNQQASDAAVGGEEDFEDEDEMEYDDEGDVQLEEYDGELENAGEGDDTDQ